jgi:hypothetical protein
MKLRRDPPDSASQRRLRLTNSFGVDKRVLETLNSQDLHLSLLALARSTRVCLDAASATLHLDGADLLHHAADPGLATSMANFVPEIGADEVASFHTRLEHFDLCLEDSWTGKLIAEAIRTSTPKDNLTILHLDDHTDMMSTLLSVDTEQSSAVNAEQCFDPTDPSDWDQAIRTGAIGIGSFMTALYELPLELDVRHLCHTPSAKGDTLSVVASTQRHPLLPDVEFAAIDTIPGVQTLRLGTYMASTRASDLIRPGQEGTMIVHVDLDYFINDFNGNIGQQPTASLDELQARAISMLDEVFAALHASRVTVLRWIIATSPGFCAASHWQMLLSEFSRRIAASR